MGRAIATLPRAQFTVTYNGVGVVVLCDGLCTVAHTV